MNSRLSGQLNIVFLSSPSSGFSRPDATKGKRALRATVCFSTEHARARDAADLYIKTSNDIWLPLDRRTLWRVPRSPLVQVELAKSHEYSHNRGGFSALSKDCGSVYNGHQKWFFLATRQSTSIIKFHDDIHVQRQWKRRSLPKSKFTLFHPFSRLFLLVYLEERNS